jgi:hypothetical protein
VKCGGSRGARHKAGRSGAAKSPAALGAARLARKGRGRIVASKNKSVGGTCESKDREADGGFFLFL